MARTRGRSVGTGLAASVIVVSCGSALPAGEGASALTPPTVPPFEPIENTVVPLPSNVTMAVGPTWAPDGNHLVFTSSETAGAATTDVSIVAQDGSDLACLTCGLANHPKWNLNDTSSGNTDFNVGLLIKSYPFHDGKRVLLAFENGPAPTSLSAWVLECAPDIYHCTTPTLVPVQQDPGDGGLLQGAITRRELRIAPDGTHLAWTVTRPADTPMVVSRLTRVADLVDWEALTAKPGAAAVIPTTFPEYVTTAASVVNPPLPKPLGSMASDYVNAGSLYELKGFADGGASVLVVRFVDSLEPDTYKVDLATGLYTRLSDYPDWNEDAGTSPDGNALVLWSDRTMGRLTAVTQIPRPALADLFSSYAAVPYLIGTAAGFSCNLQAWLLPASGDAPGNGLLARTGQPARLGQPLAPRSSSNRGYYLGVNTTGDLQWSPDSTTVALFEQANDFGVGSPASVASRLLVSHLDRTATPPQPVASSEVGGWAQTLSQYQGTGTSLSSVTLHGKVSGTVTLALAGNWAIAGTTSMTYKGYSDDGAIVLDGTEALSHLSTPATYNANLVVSGAHQGYLRASGNFFAEPPNTNGTLVSSLDGNTLSGYPPFGACPTALPSVLPLIVATAVVSRTSELATLSVTVSATVRGDTRPVRDATLVAGSTTAKTDPQGDATLVVSRGVPVTLIASAGTTFDATTTALGPF